MNLMNNFALISENLCYDQVHENIISIINNFKKSGTSIKPETKALLDEMENRIKEVRSKGISITSNNDDSKENDQQNTNGTDENNENINNNEVVMTNGHKESADESSLQMNDEDEDSDFKKPLKTAKRSNQTKSSKKAPTPAPVVQRRSTRTTRRRIS